MKRDQLEIDCLDERPDHPILLERRSVCAVQLILRTRALHDSHTAQEDEEVGTSEDGLISSNASCDLEVFVLQHDLVL